MKGLYDRVRAMPPFTRNLLLFALANTFLVNLVLKLMQGRLVLQAIEEDVGRREGTLHHARLFLLFRTWEADSWEPMTAAWRYLRSPAGGSVYDHVWFQEHLKFQYPLSSLLPIDVMHVFLPGDVIHWAPLTLVSWFAVWGTALLVALIFRDACREHLDPSILRGTSRGDDLIRMAVAAGLTVTFYPVVIAFTVGQIQPWLDFLFAAMIWLSMKRQPVAAGLMAGLMCIIKPQLGLLLIWAALRNQWRFAGALVVVVGVGSAASLAVYGLQQNLNYVSFLSYLSRHGEAYYMNQSVNGLVNRLLHNGDNAGIYPPSFAPYRWPVYVSTMLSSALVLGFAMLWRRGEHAGAPTFDLMIAGLSLTIASPIAWSHHYGILMPIYAALLPALLRWPVFGGASLAYLAGAYVLSSNLFYFTRFFADTSFTFLQSYLFFAALMVLAALYGVRRAGAREPAVPHVMGDGAEDMGIEHPLLLAEDG